MTQPFAQTYFVDVRIENMELGCKTKPVDTPAMSREVPAASSGQVAALFPT